MKPTALASVRKRQQSKLKGKYIPRVKTLLIVPASKRKAANATCVAMFGRRGANTFSVGVHLGESKEVTHYVACWDIPDRKLEQLKKLLAKDTTVADGRKPKAELSKLNLKTKSQVELSVDRGGGVGRAI
jgi:hypothetical protein